MRVLGNYFVYSLIIIFSANTLALSMAQSESMSQPTTESSTMSKNKALDEQTVINSDGSTDTYSPLTYLSTITNIPKSSWAFLKESFGPGTFWPWMGILGSTALLYAYDEEILLESQRFGRRLGLGNDDNTKAFISIGELSIFRGPTDVGSALYFLGDGWTHSGIALGFITYGESTKNHRALNTGLQIFHGMFFSTIFNQFLKRATGRESPIRRTESRGRFRPFPSIKTYGAQTADFDAYPSGHVMTATMTFTIIRENYPEYDYFLKPVEYIWVGLLAFQMMNNGVHWASDYPLGIAMGYLAGKIASRYGKKHQAKVGEKHVYFMPMIQEGALGVEAVYKF